METRPPTAALRCGAPSSAGALAGLPRTTARVVSAAALPYALFGLSEEAQGIHQLHLQRCAATRLEQLGTAHHH